MYVYIWNVLYENGSCGFSFYNIKFKSIWVSYRENEPSLYI